MIRVIDQKVNSASHGRPAETIGVLIVTTAFLLRISLTPSSLTEKSLQWMKRPSLVLQTLKTKKKTVGVYYKSSMYVNGILIFSCTVGMGAHAGVDVHV